MTVAALINKLSGLSLASGTRILVDASKDEFNESMVRWTDMDKEQPSAVIMPVSEEDAEKIVCYLIRQSYRHSILIPSLGQIGS